MFGVAQLLTFKIVANVDVITLKLQIAAMKYQSSHCYR